MLQWSRGLLTAEPWREARDDASHRAASMEPRSTERGHEELDIIMVAGDVASIESRSSDPGTAYQWLTFAISPAAQLQCSRGPLTADSRTLARPRRRGSSFIGAAVF